MKSALRQREVTRGAPHPERFTVSKIAFDAPKRPPVGIKNIEVGLDGMGDDALGVEAGPLCLPQRSDILRAIFKAEHLHDLRDRHDELFVQRLGPERARHRQIILPDDRVLTAHNVFVVFVDHDDAGAEVDQVAEHLRHRIVEVRLRHDGVDARFDFLEPKLRRAVENDGIQRRLQLEPRPAGRHQPRHHPRGADARRVGRGGIEDGLVDRQTPNHRVRNRLIDTAVGQPQRPARIEVLRQQRPMLHPGKPPRPELRQPGFEMRPHLVPFRGGGAIVELLHGRVGWLQRKEHGARALVVGSGDQVVGFHASDVSMGADGPRFSHFAASAGYTSGETPAISSASLPLS